jgi:hypothetical protein
MRRFIGLVGLVVGLAFALPAFGQNIWDITPNFEGEPAAGDPVSEGDDRIRELKLEIRQRAETEHCWGDMDTDGCVGFGAGADSGRHREGSARVFFETAIPVNLGDHTGTVDDYDSAGGGAETNALDEGRLWVDEDSDPVNAMWVYDAAFEEVSVAVGHGDDEILAGAYNLIYNGSFEATDGTGDSAAVTTPDGWVDADTDCTDAYVDPTTDLLYGEGYYYSCTATAATAEIGQELDSLAAGQTYKVLARAMDDGVTVCTLDVTGETGAAFVPSSTTANNAWTTLSGTFTTGAAFENVEVQLITVTDTNVCLWDHVAVYRIDDVATDRDEISQPGAMVFKTTSSTDDDCGGVLGAGNCSGANTGLELEVTPPGPGYIIMVYGSVHVSVTTTSDSCRARLYDGATAIAEAFFQMGSAGPTPAPEYTIFMQDTIVSPTPGTTLTLSLDVADGTTGGCELEDADEQVQAHYLEAVMLPTR